MSENRAAVDVQNFAGDVARPTGGEEDDGQADVIGGGETDTQFVEEIDVEQLGRFSLSNRYS